MIHDALYARLESLSKEDVILTMLEALDHMHAYNGRSVTECVVMALGGTVEDTNRGIRFRLPPK